MAGHNKWSKIKRKKGAADKKRSKIFSKLIKEITVAVKEADNADPEFNPRLRLAISNAKDVNMPKDNIKRAIKRASDPNTGNYLNPTYEGYSSDGIAIFIECTTDNINRTVANIRRIFNDHGGSLGENGSVAYLFERKGFFVINIEENELEEYELMLIDGGAETYEYTPEDNELEIQVAFEDFGKMQEYLESNGIEVKNARLERMPLTEKEIEDESAKKVLELVEELEDDDDVKNVFHDMKISDKIMEEIV